MNRYNQIKSQTYNLLRDDGLGNRISRAFDYFVIILIILSALLVMVLTLRDLSPSTYQSITVFKNGLTVFFIVEYILRIWSSNAIDPILNNQNTRINYIFSLRGIIDFLSLLPFVLPIKSYAFKLLRLLRLFRLFRFMHVNDYTFMLREVIKTKAPELISSLLIIAVILIAASALVYDAEHYAQPDKFRDAFDGLWWAIATVTTVGYGDLYPITATGRILAGVISLTGVMVISIPTAIISVGFLERSRKNEKINIEVIEICPECGCDIKQHKNHG